MEGAVSKESSFKCRKMNLNRLYFCNQQVKGADFVPTDRMRILSQGTLFIKDVIRQDAGDYTCVAENSIAKDSITHKLIVLGNFQHFYRKMYGIEYH